VAHVWGAAAGPRTSAIGDLGNVSVDLELGIAMVSEAGEAARKARRSLSMALNAGSQGRFWQALL
jgi:hypothetical protein